jgi:hypothetical protein
MRIRTGLAAAGAFLLLAASAVAQTAPGLQKAFPTAAWTKLPADAATLPPAHARVVSYDAAADPGLTLDHLLNGAGRPALEAVLREGGAVFVRRRAAASAFASDPLLSLQLACPTSGQCPGFTAFAATATGLVVIGGEVEGGYLLAAPAAPAILGGPMLRQAEPRAIPQFAMRLPASVPEPRSWALLILGFGLVGAAARRGPILSGRRLA